MPPAPTNAGVHGGRRENARSHDDRRHPPRSTVGPKPQPSGRTNPAPLEGRDGQAQKHGDSVPWKGSITVMSDRQVPSFKSPPSTPEINIVVLGAVEVGKSTLIQRVWDHALPPASQVTQRTINAEGSSYHLRLLEMDIDDVEIDKENNTIIWPDLVEGKMMPKVHGVMALYAVTDEATLGDVPAVLDAVSRSGVPSILVSSKCDVVTQDREVDPLIIEQRAKRSLRNLLTVQTSGGSPGSHKLGLSMILRSIIGPPTENASHTPARRRGQSNSMGSVSPRPDSRGHARHSSEQSRTYHKDRHSRHDSSLAPSNSEDRLQVPSSLEDMHRSFLLEDTGSEDSIGGSAHSNVATMKGASVRASPSSTISESGSSFDELVDRLMAPPVSKADNKFRAIFLALYRKFAAPGRLLEAIVERFDALERDGSPQMNRTTNQLRYLVILQQWVETYPGDFAWPKTKRRMRTFVAKLSLIKIFAAAAKEMAGNLECVHEDADTNWAFCDRDAANGNADERFSIMSSTASLLLDDPTFHLEDFSLGSSYSNDDPSSSAKSNSVSSTASSQSILTFEAAQRQTATLVPNPRYALTKVQWRMLIDLPDDVIAKEMTRIDWLMFCCIKPRDLARQVTQSTAERESCKNQIHSNRMSDHFNNVARWVENYVMLRDKPKHRALMLEKMFRIGRKLRELNNYNSLGALIAGVKSTAIHRLAETRALIPVEVHKDWMKLDLLMSHSRSYFAYRLGWENTHSERIPYMPLLHRDMLSSEVGNKTFFGPEHDGRINWKKLEIQGEVLVTMQKAQGMPYKNLTSSRLSEQVRELLLEVKMMKDDEEIFERSKQLEPMGGAHGGASAKLRHFFRPER